MKLEINESEFNIIRRALIFKMAHHVKQGMSDMKYDSRQRHIFDAENIAKMIDKMGEKYVDGKDDS